MKITVQRNGKTYNVDLKKGLDISMPITSNPNATRAWYIDEPKIEPVVMGNWVGKVNNGSGVNFYNIQFNPHAHGTHTETAGHVLEKRHSINQNLKEYFFWAELISVSPKLIDGNQVITLDEIKSKIHQHTEALVLRTLPNLEVKKETNYSDSNPPYLSVKSIQWIKERGVKHLMIDLPSVDPERDNGAVAAHHAFWDTHEKLRLDATITELIYVDSSIADGLYFMNLQVAAFENDAAPSRPVLYLPEEG